MIDLCIKITDMETVQISKEQFDKLINYVRELHRYFFDNPQRRDDDDIELLSVREANEATGVSESSFYRAIKKGIIKKNSYGKLSPLDIDDAFRKKLIAHDPLRIEEFRRNFIRRKRCWTEIEY